MRLDGQFDAALGPATEALEIQLKTNGPDHSYTANALYTKANVLIGLQRYREAHQLALDASRIRADKLGRQHREYWQAELTVARALLRLGENSTAAETQA